MSRQVLLKIRFNDIFYTARRQKFKRRKVGGKWHAIRNRGLAFYFLCLVLFLFAGASLNTVKVYGLFELQKRTLPLRVDWTGHK